MKPHFERDPTNKGALKQRRSRKERKATSKAKSNDNESAHSMQTDQDVITTEAQSESTMQA
jgi:hypothetical protein